MPDIAKHSNSTMWLEQALNDLLTIILLPVELISNLSIKTGPTGQHILLAIKPHGFSVVFTSSLSQLNRNNGRCFTLPTTATGVNTFVNTSGENFLDHKNLIA